MAPLSDEIRAGIKAVIDRGETLGDGRPDLRALKAELDRDISSEERDSWFEEYKSEDEAASEPEPDEGEVVVAGADVTAEDITVSEFKRLPKEFSEKDRSKGVIWAGPAISGSVHLPHGRIYRAGVLPEDVAAYLENHPEIAPLMVPVKAYPAAKAEISRGDKSPLGRAHNRALNLIGWT